MKSSELLLITTGTTVALMSGFFFSFSISVSVGLGKLGNIEFLNAMQNINREVQNPLFFICFFGTLIILPITCFQYYHQRSFTFLAIATLFYFLGVFMVTVLANVPLNNKLELFNLSKSTGFTIRQMRDTFEKSWNVWNHIRTVSSLVSMLFVILACLLSNEK